MAERQPDWRQTFMPRAETEAEAANNAASGSLVQSAAGAFTQLVAKGVDRGLSETTIGKRADLFMRSLERPTGGNRVMGPGGKTPMAANSFGAQPGARGLKENWGSQLGFSEGTFKTHGGMSFGDWVAKSRVGSGQPWRPSQDTGLGNSRPGVTYNWKTDRGLGASLSSVLPPGIDRFAKVQRYNVSPTSATSVADRIDGGGAFVSPYSVDNGVDAMRSSLAYLTSIGAGDPLLTGGGFGVV